MRAVKKDNENQHQLIFHPNTRNELLENHIGGQQELIEDMLSRLEEQEQRLALLEKEKG